MIHKELSQLNIKDIEYAKNYLEKNANKRSVCQNIIDLFFVNKYFSLQQKSGIYFVARENLFDKESKMIEISPEIVWMALCGQITIGTYIVSQNSTTKLIAIDFDAPRVLKDGSNREEELAKLKPKVIRSNNYLKGLGFKTYLEYSGHKGYHIFAFFKEPMPTEWCFHAAKLAVHSIDAKTETFPKQKSLEGLKFGSLIKLPLCIHNKSGQRSTFLTDDFEPIHNFKLSEIEFTDKEALNKAYNISIKLLPKNKVFVSSPEIKKEDINPYDIRITGPNQRHRQQFFFILRCFEAGYSPEEAMKHGSIWLDKYNNFFESEMTHALFEMKNCVESVYSGRYNKAPVV